MKIAEIALVKQVPSQFEMKLSPHVVEAPASNLETKQLELVKNLLERSGDDGKALPSLQVFLVDFEAWCQALTKSKDHISSLANSSLKAWTQHNEELANVVTSDRKFAEVNRDYLAGANLAGANLTEAILIKANLAGANLTEANLTEAILIKAILSGANLCKADLSGANLSGANLWSAKLRGADLRGADLSGANLWGAKLRGAQLDYKGIRQLLIFKEFTEEIPKERNYGKIIDHILGFLKQDTTLHLILPRTSEPRHVHYYRMNRTEKLQGSQIRVEYFDNELKNGVQAYFRGEFTYDLKTGETDIISYTATDASGNNQQQKIADFRPSLVEDSFYDLRSIIAGTVSPGQGSSIAVYEGKKRLSITYPAHIPSTAPDEKVREWADLQGIVLI